MSDLGEHAVYHEVMQLILAAHMPVEGAGNHAKRILVRPPMARPL
ncbi:MAG TPA: hypothetical protein VMU94_15895 [Streptosporangiaceae bacterium]|nr:hypothetical protein [Streptosporangiaceae bacterium]